MLKLFNRLLGRLDTVPSKPKISRSSEWTKVREKFIKEMGAKCSVCGKTTNLEVHHIIPVHIDPSKELDMTNLIVLCENKSIFCHFVFGHFMNWKSYNPEIRNDSLIFYEKILTRP